MKIVSFKNLQELSIETELMFRNLHQQKQSVLRGFFPTGRSVEEFYALLRKNKNFWAKKFIALQIDEFMGTDRLFYRSLDEQILTELDLQEHQEVIQSTWTENQMLAHIEKVLSKPIDFALLGLGPNGHVGFHEPNVGDAQFLGGKVHLTQESFQRVKNAPGPWALTFGAGSFLRAKMILMIVTGENKAESFKKLCEMNPSPSLPASLLKTHPDFTVFTTL